MAIPARWVLGWFLGVALLGVVSADGQTGARGYDLAVENDLVTLHVQDGNLVQVLEDLGRRLGFELVADWAEDERVTAEFEKLPSDEAIRRTCSTVGFVGVPDPETGKLIRLVLTPVKSRGANRLDQRREPVRERAAVPDQQHLLPAPPADSPPPEKAPEKQKDD